MTAAFRMSGPSLALRMKQEASPRKADQMVTKAAIHPSGSTVGEEKALEGRQQHPQREEEVEAEEEPEEEVVEKGGKVVSMELAYVTEHIIALWLPAVECDARDAKQTNEDAQEQMLAEAVSMLRVKHADNCMVFDLSIPKEADLHNETCCLGMSSHYLGWQGSTLAPPLERLCSACKYIESWLSTNPQHIAVLFSRGPSSKERIGVVISAYLTYSGICSSEEQALDRFAMGRFFKDKIGRLTSPSNVRYVSHFSGLLSGGIRMNAEPLFLTNITIHGAPAFNANSKGNSTYPWRSNGFGTDVLVLSQDDMDRCGKQQTFHFFLKIYQQGLTLVYSSPVYELSASSEQLTIGLENMQTYPTDSPLHLRGDVLIKGYYLCRNQLCEGCHCNSSGHTLHRHALFQCQFHTCAVAKRSLCFSKAELDEVDGNEGDFKYPPDNGVLELHFSGLRESWTCAASSIPLASEASPEGGCCAQPPLSSALYLPYADEEEEQFLAGSIVAHNSMEELRTSRKKKGGEESTAEAVADWANGVLDKECEGTDCRPRSRLEEVGHLSGPLDGSLYATVSKGHPANERTEWWRQMDLSCGEGSAVRSVGVDARSAASSPHRAACAPTPTSPLRSTVAASDTRRREALHSPPLHARLDELLGDMLMTVENIPDLRPPPCEGQPGGGEAEEDIPYHARRDGRPFTYGAVPERKTERLRKEEDDDDMHSELSSPGLVRRASRAGGRAERKGEGREEGRLPMGDDEDADGYSSIDTYTSLTWLQQQQQKLRDRREGKTRLERCPQEFRLLRELRTYQRCSSASGTQTLPAGGRWQGREDGYASDTSLPVGLDSNVPDHNGSVEGEDDWDGRAHGWRERVEWSRRGESRKVGENLTLPLRINTGTAGAVVEEKNMLSEPGSPLLPRRSVSRETASRYTTGTAHVMAKSREESTLRTIGSGVTMQSLYGRSEPQMERERPFVAVKRAHELAATRHKSKDSTGSFDDGMTTSVSQSRDDSFSSWATVSMPWGEEEDEEVDEETEEEDGDSRKGKARPQTPAFPVHPRTPYSNGSTTHVGYVDHQQNSTFVDDHGIATLPPKSPTTIRKDRLQMSVSPELQQQLAANQRPLMANGGSAVQKQALSTEIAADIVSTPSSGGLRQLFGEHQEVSPAHVKFVRDTSRFWYKPTISREEAIAILRDKQPGTFIVRDSNSFPGAFGLALKVATPPTNVPSRISSSATSNLDMQNELVRHFLIEPTSRGVKLKGCVNEPVFSSLSALVYQHSLTAMALPCRLILPESEPAVLRTVASTDGSVNSNQILLQQGAACNVLYLISVDTESLTGPQAVRRAVADLFSKQPMPAPTVVHFKVSGQGITLTDNKRKLFFRRHYPVNSISHCGLDPDDHRWTEKNEDLGNSICSNRCFGFVARKPSSKGDNQCHIFAELDPEQPASAIVNFVTRVMMAGTVGKTSNIV